MISVVLGAAIALVGALAVIAVDWERLRAWCLRFAAAHDVAIFQDGFAFGLVLVAAVLLFVTCCFVGAWTVGSWIWSVA